MSTLKKRINSEIINRIEEKLNAELKRIKKVYVGAITHLGERQGVIDDLISVDISLDYFEIPLIELEDSIKQIYPIVDELGIKISLAYIDWDWANNRIQIAKVSSPYFESTTKLDHLTEEQYQDYRDLLWDIVDFYEAMDIGLLVEFQEINNEYNQEFESEEDEEEKMLKVKDIYKVSW